MPHDNLDFNAGVILDFLEDVHRGELVQGKIGGLFFGDALHRDFEDLAGGAVRVLHRVHDDELAGLGFAQGQVEEDVPDAGAHVQGQDVAGQVIGLVQAADHRGAEAVVARRGCCRSRR